MHQKLRELNKLGEYEEVIHIINDIQVNGNRMVLYEKAKALMGLQQYDEALVILNSILIIKPDWLGAAKLKMHILLILRKYDELFVTFVHLVNNSSKSPTKDSEFPILFNEMLDFDLEHKLDLLHASLEYYKFKIGNDDTYCYFKGVVESNLGNLHSAENYFKQITNTKHLGRHSTGANSFLFMNYDNAKMENMVGVSMNKKLFPENFKSIVLVSCDNNYFNKFANVFLKGVTENLINKICHFHIINPDDNTICQLNSFARSNVFFNFSYEYMQNASKLYYACSRFMQLNFIQEWYQRDVIVCDIDAYFKSDFDNLLEQNFDILLKVDNNCNLHLLPWRGVAAGFCIFKNNARVSVFSKNLRRYLLNFVSENAEKFWYLDQTALFSVSHEFEKYHNLNVKRFMNTSSIIIFPNGKEPKEVFVQRFQEI